MCRKNIAGMLSTMETTQAKTTATDAFPIVRWFWAHTGDMTDTQRSALIMTSRKMLLNMFRNITKEENLHMASPNIQSSVTIWVMLNGRKAQNIKSEIARLRYQVVLMVLFILQPAIQITTPLPQIPRRKISTLITTTTRRYQVLKVVTL